MMGAVFKPDEQMSSTCRNGPVERGIYSVYALSTFKSPSRIPISQAVELRAAKRRKRRAPLLRLRRAVSQNFILRRTRQMPVRSNFQMLCRLQIGDTADYKSALRGGPIR
jgi:hypothetical protein